MRQDPGHLRQELGSLDYDPKGYVSTSHPNCPKDSQVSVFIVFPYYQKA